MEEKYPVKTPDVVVRQEEKEALLFNPADGNMLCINSTGIFVWKMCDGKVSCKGIAKELTEEFDVSVGKAEEDCLKYLNELEGSGFIGYKV